MSNTTSTIVKASAQNLHIAPRKMSLVTNLVKGMKVSDALVQLRFLPKKGAPMLHKLLESAVANAEHNFGLKRQDLVIKTLRTNMGSVMKRMFPRARGSAFVIRRKLAHVYVELESKAAKPVAKKPVAAKAESKPELKPEQN